MAIWNRLFARRRRYNDLSASIHEHLEEKIEELVDSGMPRREAEQAARRAFGNVTLHTERSREAWQWPLLESIWADIRFALRQFLKSPGFTVTVVLTLMLGIGSTAAIFSVVDRILFRPLPYAHGDQLVSVGLVAPIEPQEFILGGSYYEWQDNQKPFAAMTSETGVEPCDLTQANPMRLTCAHVESNFLPTLGVTPVLGRNFTATEDRPNGPKVALISFALWRSRFNGDPTIPGKVIQIDGAPTEIVGVLPRNFEMPRLQAADLLEPEALDIAAQRRSNPGRPMWAFARLKDGISPEQAKAQLEPLFEYSLREAPAPFRKEVHYTVRSLRDRQFQSVHRAAWVLFALVLSVLLIACANIAGLLLARRAGRQREMAMRAALGARPLRLLRQAITESLLLSLIGAVAGLAFASCLLHIFLATAPEGLPFLASAGIDARVLVFTIAASIGCAIAFGIAGATRRIPMNALTTHAGFSLRRARPRQILVAIQIATSLVLLTGAALMMRSFWNLQRQSLGLQGQNVITATLSLGQASYPTSQRQMAFFKSLERNLRWGPGVNAVAISDSVPPGGPHGEQIYASLRIDGQPRFAGGTGGNVTWRRVTPDYFRALGIPILQGSGFAESDANSGNRFVVLSRALATRMFPMQDALGRQIHVAAGAPDAQDPPYTVVGIAADVKNGGLAAGEQPEYYRLRSNRPEDWHRDGVVIVKTGLPAATAEQWIRAQIAAFDPTLPVQIETLQDRVDKLSDPARFQMLLIGYFAFTGLVLSVVGLYGVTSFLMEQRRPEVGIRMALGASRVHIVKMFLTGAMWMVLPGAIIGLALSFAFSRTLASLLFEVGPHDPAMFIGATALLVSIAGLAALIPALSAAHVNPTTALRSE
jgi:putative ABC transport system permease protein